MASPSFSSKSIDNPLTTPDCYSPSRPYSLITRNEQPKTPLGDNWNFKPCSITTDYINYAERIKNFVVRPDDIWVISYPKSGTTWTLEMTWLFMNNFDFEKSKNLSHFKKASFLEFSPISHQIPFDSVEQSNLQPSQRLMKSHLPIALLPDQLWIVKPKIIYVTRNPKDVAVSYCHHQKGFFNYTGDVDDYAELIMDGDAEYGPFKDHIQEFWSLRNQENILFITYEEMQKDLRAIIKRTSSFLNKPVNDDQIKGMENFLSFKNMKKNIEKEFDHIASRDGFSFFRKGKNLSSKEELTPEVYEKMCKWMEDNFKNIYPEIE